jgi:sugar phosphate isomerase/epimerase
MTAYTRREFGQLTLAGLAMAGRPKRRPLHAAGASSTVNGVHLGVQTYSFRDLPRPSGADDSVDVVIKAMTEAGLTECELFSPHIEPQFSAGARGQRGAPPPPEAVKAREDLRRWRIETPIDHFRGVKKKFDAAGITIYAFCHNMNTSFTDAEIDRGFEVAHALGATVMTTSTTLEVARRIAPIADGHKMNIGMHGHSNVTDPNEFATPESFAAAMKMSKYFKVNLDIGHFAAADFDPIAYMKAHHADITNLHIKDRRKHQGDNTPWGEGDTPIREVLQLLKKERWPIPAYIEYEYRGRGTPVEEVTKCLAYMKAALA